ncbi:hypothetical protein EJ05DRAFT_500760 [Pseudovirgaria hyperparasitica]|uniref:Heterokaryon incompatibility domain-containing protein n=1 Tax=Pseudovirgaria hyperparasitica TaxID=470096 RepID=A0A6A6W6J6_9PEZI|nr:uncharacterized protein EJ05DRAFT_500760 [Pseudovirgaria hyperparasitica]KAF2758243.1 hypothetical protein EJ05DRAFT_500760 [Pseudovirgaria hyperparasitica]
MLTSPDGFEYQPLDTDGSVIRLLRLGRGRDLSVIQCTLKHVSLVGANQMPYEALSYTWGGKLRSVRIEVNGVPHMVTYNLAKALTHLRYTDQKRLDQVQLMKRIFNQADQVIFWLGDANRDTNILFNSLNQLLMESTKRYSQTYLDEGEWREIWQELQYKRVVGHSEPYLTLRQTSGLRTLFDQPWFNRMWFIREVVLARTAEVCCGYKSTPARIFALAPVVLGIWTSRSVILDIMPGSSTVNQWWVPN